MAGGLPFLSSLPHDVQRDEFTHAAFPGNNIPQCSVRGYVGPCPALKFWEFCSKLMTPSLRDFFLCVLISECIFFSFGWKCEHCFKERTASTKGIDCAIWGPGSDGDEVSVLAYYAVSTCKQLPTFRRPKCLHFQVSSFITLPWRLAQRFSETIVTTHCYQSTLRNVAEDLNLKQACKFVLSGMHEKRTI